MPLALDPRERGRADPAEAGRGEVERERGVPRAAGWRDEAEPGRERRAEPGRDGGGPIDMAGER